ncbi:cytochrome P450 [Amycolatopsis coloradensis]|uniref:Cytochrome P450 n=1 Tax=Amycolatopsis coloradensis TaxID=76021 RepID=A0ACD5BH86_9PSEU
MVEMIPEIHGLPMTRSCPFDPPDELSELREQAPLSRLIFPDGHRGWLVTNHALARTVLADPRFSNRNEFRHWPVERARTQTRHVPTLPGMFSRLDPPEYTRYRRLLAGQFTVRRMATLEPRITEIADACVDEMLRVGPPADLQRDFAVPIPSQMICELIGVPLEDREAFLERTNVLVDMKSTSTGSGHAWAYIHDYVRKLVAAKRADPGEDLLSGLTESDLTDEELTGAGVTLIVAGLESTANMIALGIHALLQNPDQLALLLDDMTLLENAIEELVRYQTIIHIGPFRGALEDVELEGVQVKRGEVVLVSLPAANRDPLRFDDPDRLDLRRTTTGHVGFGHGIHQCIGQQLARAELRIGYSVLLRRLPGLRVTLPPEEIAMRHDMGVYGVKSLPVEWDA